MIHAIALGFGFVVGAGLGIVALKFVASLLYEILKREPRIPGL